VALFLNIQTGNLRLAVLSAWDPTTLSEIVPHLPPCALTVRLRKALGPSQQIRSWTTWHLCHLFSQQTAQCHPRKAQWSIEK
jgi:hypothetical protein